MTDSNLKIFIVGPKRAGKTVFACMLNAHVMAHPTSGIICKVRDAATNQYFAEITEELSNQRWPQDTLPLKTGQEHTELKWEWEFDRNKAFFDLVDPAGEDIERAMRGEGNELPIVARIRASDVLFVLVDLHGHQGDAAGKRAQNGWIIQKVLQEAESVRQLVIGISKGDLIAGELPDEAWTDKDKVMAMMSKNLPQANLAAYRQLLQKQEVQVVMFSAVSTETHLVEGVLRLRPRMPLASQGLEPFVKAIIQAHADKKREDRNQRALAVLKLITASRLFRIVVAAALVLLLTLWWWEAAHQTIKITFKTSSSEHAGTDDLVGVNLMGSQGASGWLEFEGSQHNNNADPFEKGSVDVFERKIWAVGSISMVKVRLSDSNKDGGWLLKEMSVEEWRDGAWGPKTTFVCDVWLKRSAGYETERTLRK